MWIHSQDRHQGHGVVTRKLLQRFTSRRAFIYFLEIYAQLLAFVAHLDDLPHYWISFIGSSSGLAALQKGYGRDPAVNLLLTLFWAMASEQAWVPEFQWVPSDLNLADPVSRGIYLSRSLDGCSWILGLVVSKGRFSTSAPITWQRSCSASGD